MMKVGELFLPTCMLERYLYSYVSCCYCSFHYGFLIFFVFRLINVVFFLFFFHCMHFDLHNLGLCGFKVIHSLSFLASVVNDDCKRVKVVGVLHDVIMC